MSPTLLKTARFQKLAADAGEYGEGTYWVSKLAKNHLRDYLRECSVAGMGKYASIGGDQEQGFEQAFSSLAYAYLKDKSPRLIDYIVGFQLVDRNEDNTKAMGLFGMKVGEQWLYAPTFFLNGDLKGHELLYIKKQDAFVPMKENWVNYLISRKPHVLGEASDKDTFQLGGVPPNLTRFTRPPTVGKYGSDRGGLRPEIAAWAVDFCAFVGAAGTKCAAAVYRDLKKEDRAVKLAMDKLVARPFAAALAGSDFDLRKFLGSHVKLASAAFDIAQKYPLIKTGFEKFYGKDFFVKLAEEFQAQESSLIKTAMNDWYANGGMSNDEYEQRKQQRRKRVKSGSLIPDAAKPLHPLVSGDLQIYTIDPFSLAIKRAAETMKVDEDAPSGFKQNVPDLTDAEREKLLKDTVLIKDKRDPHGKSEVYNTQVRMELTNPGETGIYEVLEKPGTFSEMLVIFHPQTNRGREEFATVVRLSDPRNWLNIHASNLWVKSNPQPERPDFTKWWDKLSSTESPEKNGYYVAIGANGSGTTPFRIRESYENGAYKADFKDHCDYGKSRPTWARPTSLGSFDPMSDWVSTYDARIFINQREGTSLRSVNGELAIPKSYKIFKLKDPPPPPKKDDKDSLIGCCPITLDEDQSAKSPIQPGTMVDVQMLLHEKTGSLKLIDMGSDIVVKTDRGTQQMSKKAALISLVGDHGLSEEAARETIRTACTPKGHAQFRIKYADGFGGPNRSVLEGGPGAPAFPQPDQGMEQVGYRQYPAIYGQEEMQQVPGMEADRTDPTIYDPFYQPDQHAMQMAQEAGQSGQKEVFDTAMVSGMLKAVRQDSLVDRYLGDLMKALDKLGRILFMFYWHQEEFEDRYGKQDLPELEDSLRNAFEVLGDVCLFLKEKQVGGGLDGFGGMNNKSEPDVSEAARN